MRKLLASLFISGMCLLPSVAQADAPVTTCITAPLTVTAALYAANNDVGGLISFPLPGSLLSGILESVQIDMKSVQTAAFKLYLFTSQPTNSTWTDKVTPAINAADTLKPIGPFTFAANDSGLGTQTSYNISGIAAPYTSATSTLYGVLVTTGAPTFTSTSDVQVQACVLPG